ncbi:MAG: helix-turn-helix transcriptional regulator [Clostridia bacterium]|nr:helix-turn-helix transcriptional regulator [Clostridia bacterium]
MAVSYNRLWKLLVGRKMSPAELRKASGIAPNKLTKLRNDLTVNLSILEKVCKALSCDFGDFVEYADDPR